jgi:ABC-type lipoprotein release transport system permease subunit
MKLILLIAFRNLFRQKARSLFMGLGICLAVMIMIIGYSFSKGLSLNIVNKGVEANIFGHFMVNMVEKNDQEERAIIRDRDKMATVIKGHLENIRDVREALITAAFAVGNRQGMIMRLTGFAEPYENMFKKLTLLEGDLEKFKNREIENPLILARHTAESLNVKVGDVVRIRLNTIYDQVQTARLNLVAIVIIENPLLNDSVQGALPLNDLKEILGYQPHEASSFNIVLDRLEKTSDLITYADDLHDKLLPEPISISGEFHGEGISENGAVTGIQSNKDAIDLFKKYSGLTDAVIEAFMSGSGKVVISKCLAGKLNTSPGDKITFLYNPKFGAQKIEIDLEVVGIIGDTDKRIPYVAFINEKDFYRTFLNNLPEKMADSSYASIFNSGSPLFSGLTHSWKLAERTYSYVDLVKKQRERRQNNTSSSPIMDIVTLQEGRNMLFQQEAAINLMSIVVMLIIFFITLMGLLNTIRMNIRERTQEIGTVRAVGMQKRMVVLTLVTEIGLLAVFAALFGILFSYITMDLLSMITFHTTDLNFKIMLDNGHLKFVPIIKTYVIYIFIIIILTTLAAWSPSRKAVKKPVAEALGHYE